MSQRVFVIGDSISIQYGPYLSAALEGLGYAYARKGQDAGEAEMQAALANLDIPQGANGGDSSMVLTYLDSRLKENRPIRADLLLLNCGLHDIKTDLKTGEKQVPLDRYRENLRQIIARVEQMGPRLVWIRTTPCDEAIHNKPGSTFHRFRADNDAYNAVADEEMQRAGVPIIDLHAFTRSLGPEAELYCDHVHFHEPMRRVQGAFLAGWVAGWAGRA